MRDKRRVRRDNDDDRAVVVAREESARVGNIIGNLPADGDTGNTEIGTPSVVALH